jgi:hypothetical protein
MVPQEYIDMGFEILPYDSRSKALQFDKKPIYIWGADSMVDSRLLKRICDLYLNICERKTIPVIIRSA